MSRLDFLVVATLLVVALIFALQLGVFDAFPWSRLPVLTR